MSDIDAEALLKSCDPAVRDYVAFLKSENRKLSKQVIKQQAEAITYQNQISALESIVKESPKPAPSITIMLTQADGTVKQISPPVE